MADQPKMPTGPKPPGGTGLTPPQQRDRAVVRPSNAPTPVNPGSKTKDLVTAPPKLEMPKGGGAIKGIGEKFQANAVTGTASFSVPIALSPGRNGFTPALSLSYDSGSGNGPFGMGWSVGIPRIQRKTDRGLPRYRDSEDSDTFVISDAEDLVPFRVYASGAWSELTLANITEGADTYSRRRYRPRVEGGFARIERWKHTTTGAFHWRTWSKENIRRIYGKDAGARLVDPNNAAHVFRWCLEEERDELGNLIRYEYEAEDRAGAPVTPAEKLRTVAGNGCTNLYLKRVLYGNVEPNTDLDGWLFEVVFDYGDHSGDPDATPATAAPHNADQTWPVRQDVFSDFRSGFDIRCYRLCRRVLMFHRFEDPKLEHEFDVDEETRIIPTLVRSTELSFTESPVATTVTAIVHRGWRNDGAGWDTLTMPPVEFGYGESIIDATVQFMDGIEDLPNGLDTSLWQWIDLDGEGLTGLLAEHGGQWIYKRNLGAGELGPARIIRTKPAQARLGDARSRLMDVDGDGRLELVSLHPGMAGTYSRDEDGEWQGMRPFRSMPTRPLDDPNVRLLDIDGDGKADILVTEDDCFTWYPSLGLDGWGKPEQRRKLHDEEKGPTLVFSNQGESIYLADMTGDGLTDIVRVRNRNICYWPNRGYGRFGGKVQMQGAPWFDAPDRFDPKRIRFADVDGSGPADLLYLGPTGVRIWQNQCGNRWSSETVLPQFPGVEDTARIEVADLLGDGTACLVWSSPLWRDAWQPIRFVHLMADGKPYLLRTVNNNLGRVTTLTYAPSTQFYVADREKGQPWATRIPFPIQVLERVRVDDLVTEWSNDTFYAYHHGYYDSDEREFRGFGKVEQWDTEKISLNSLKTDVVAVRTVSWFHTGAWRRQPSTPLETTYASEYFVDSAALTRVRCAVAVLDTDPGVLRPIERREAHRALKGRPLRVEVYAEGNAVPYTVTETAFTSSRLQRGEEDQHGVFLVTPLSTISYHYEQNATDPRVVQERVLAVDEYGTVTKAITVAFPRRGVTLSTPTPTVDELAQGVGVAIVTRTEVIHDVDHVTNPDRWHVGVPYRSRAWHLTPPPAPPPSIPPAADIPGLFGAVVDPARVIGTTGSLNTWLDVAVLVDVPAGSPTAAEVIAWDGTPTSTPWLRKVSDKLVTYDNGSGAEATAGTMGPVALPWQTYQLAYAADQAADLEGIAVALDAAHTLEALGYIELTATPFTSPLLPDKAGAWARSGTQTRDAAHFYVSTSFVDPFGATTTLTWGSGYLFPTAVEDALGNTVSAEYDLVALAPLEVVDPNANPTIARYDALGRVTAVARASDTGDGETDLDDPSQEYSYDLDTVPASAYAAVRDTHASAGPSTGWIESYTYSDGGGNAVMQKATAAPDAATPSTPRWVGTGRVVLNNKGMPIRQYEPFFSATPDFDPEEGFEGVSPTIFYDPVGRAMRVELPNGTLRRIAFSPWYQATFDENDTSDEPACTADVALRARANGHEDTPTVVKLDVQGRPYRTREWLTAPPVGATYEAGGTPITTTLTLDVTGNPRVVNDAIGNDTQKQTFDMLGRPILTESPDAGDITAVFDVTGQPRFLFKSGDLCEEAEYDALRRKVRTWEWATSGTPAKTLRERFVYGEGLETGGYNPAVDDLRGRLVRVYDGAGRVTSEYDWKGNPTSTTRTYLDDEEAEGDWTAHDDADYPFTADTSTALAALETGAETELEAEYFTTSATFDALDRVVTSTSPATASSTAHVTANTYDAGGRLHAVAVDSVSVVTSIAYNARGQRESIAYGNGTKTTYTYEADTFRLATLVTMRTSPSARIQDLQYTYDPVGNIRLITNLAEDTTYYNNAPVTPDQSFVYDALYRLVEATGREKDSRGQPYWSGPDLAVVGAEVLAEYEETYTYDGVGNIQTMAHSGASNWTRTYVYVSGTNRLYSTTEGGVEKRYKHDARGNMTYLPWLLFSSGEVSPNVTPGYRVPMKHALLPTSSEEAFYTYDAGDMRARKVVKKGVHTQRRYVGGWEVWRQYSGGSVVEEMTSLHVMDGESRVLMIETLTDHPTETVPQVIKRFQLGNHLGSVAVELDDTGGLISYEEYHPYGSTAWWAGNSLLVSQKRYRYTGMEKDEETGLSYHHHRYYATWIGRWTSSDPIGLAGGANRFQYAANCPMDQVDPSGLAPVPTIDQAVRRGNSRLNLPPELLRPLSGDGASFDAGSTGPRDVMGGIAVAKRGLEKLERVGMDTRFYRAGIGRGDDAPAIDARVDPENLGETSGVTGNITFAPAATDDTSIHEGVHGFLSIAGIPQDLREHIVADFSGSLVNVQTFSHTGESVELTLPLSDALKAMGPERAGTFFSEVIAYQVEASVHAVGIVVDARERNNGVFSDRALEAYARAPHVLEVPFKMGGAKAGITGRLSTSTLQEIETLLGAKLPTSAPD